MEWAVEIKRTPSSKWAANGVVETNHAAAMRIWAEICRDLGHRAFRLVPVEKGT